MKALNQTHKKWILTASLASLLSFNLVMSLTGGRTYTADFASSASDAESTTVIVKTERGLVKTKFSALEDGKTLAETSPATEAGSKEAECKECTFKTYQITMAYSDENLGDLKAAIKSKYKLADKPKEVTITEVKASKDEGDDTPTPVAKKASKKTETDDDVEASAPKNEALAQLEKKCSREKDEMDAVNCYGVGLAKLLNKKSSPIDEESATEMWRENVREGLITALTDTSNPTTHELALDIMKKMETGINRAKYANLRKEILLSATQSVANQYKKAQRIALSNNYNPQAFESYRKQMMKADALRLELQSHLDSTLPSADEEMKAAGYELPTAKIQEALKNYQPYKPLKDITMDVYEGGYVVERKGATGAGSVASTNLRKAAPEVLSQQGIGLKKNTNMNPSKVDPGTAWIDGSNHEANSGTICKRGTNCAQGQPQMNQQQGRVNLPPAPGGIPVRQ